MVELNTQNDVRWEYNIHELPIISVSKNWWRWVIVHVGEWWLELKALGSSRCVSRASPGAFLGALPGTPPWRPDFSWRPFPQNAAAIVKTWNNKTIICGCLATAYRDQNDQLEVGEVTNSMLLHVILSVLVWARFVFFESPWVIQKWEVVLVCQFFSQHCFSSLIHRNGSLTECKSLKRIRHT